MCLAPVVCVCGLNSNLVVPPPTLPPSLNLFPTCRTSYFLSRPGIPHLDLQKASPCSLPQPCLSVVMLLVSRISCPSPPNQSCPLFGLARLTMLCPRVVRARAQPPFHPFPPQHTHTHTHTPTHTHSLTHTHTYTHTLTHARTHAHTHTCAHAHKKTEVDVYTHTHTYTDIHTHVRTHTHAHTYMRAHAQTSLDVHFSIF